MIKRILQDACDTNVFVDGTFISSKSTDDHLMCIEVILERFKHYNARIRTTECDFLTPSVNYHSVVINSKRVNVDASSVLDLAD